MTSDDLNPTGPNPEELLDGLDPGDLDGHTIEELSDYLDAGRLPRDPSIENSAGSRIALDALARLRRETWAMLEGEASADPDRDRVWIKNVLANISRESKAGRDIPVGHPDPTTTLKVTEGSVRGLIRAVVDGTGGAIVGKVALEGDVTIPREAITVHVTASGAYGENLTALAQRIRDLVVAALDTHTELNVVGVDVAIQDVHTGNVTSTKDPR